MLDVQNLTFGYGNKLILDSISFQCRPGQCMAVLGNNGCGKTTLMKVLDRILTASRGQIHLNGEDLSALNRQQLSRRIAYVCQDNQPGGETVFDAILLGRKPYIRMTATAHDYEVVESVIHQLHLESNSMRATDELSGGEYQKVVLGRALAQEPEILLLDEPTSNLDMRNQKEVLERVTQIVKEKSIMALVVIHDVNSALRFCDHFLFLKNQKVFAAGGREIVSDEIISEVYGLPVSVEMVRKHPVVVYD